MSILDAAGGATAPDTTSTDTTASTEGQTIDSLNQQFQNTTDGKTVSADSEGTADTAGWYYDENMPGTGERPEWLKDKYKSAADQAKAYNELDKKLGKFKGAPETYDLTLPDMPDFKFEDGDPVLSEFLDMAKESQASQEFVTKALAHYVKAQNFYAPDPQEEIQKIGINAKAEISQLNEWASQRLDKNEYEVFKSMVTTADAFKVLQKLRRVSTSNTDVAVTNSHAPNNSKAISERQLLDMIADPKYSTDPLFRAEVDAKAQHVWG